MPDDLAIRKPVLRLVKDYDERLLDTKLIVPHSDEQLVVRNYMFMAQCNPLQPISLEALIRNE